MRIESKRIGSFILDIRELDRHSRIGSLKLKTNRDQWMSQSHSLVANLIQLNEWMIAPIGSFWMRFATNEDRESRPIGSFNLNEPILECRSNSSLSNATRQQRRRKLENRVRFEIGNMIGNMTLHMQLEFKLTMGLFPMEWSVVL